MQVTGDPFPEYNSLEQEHVLAKESPSSEKPRPIRHLLRRLIQAPAVWSILWPLLLLVVGCVAWQHWGAKTLAMQYQSVQLDAIRVSAPPEPIRSKVDDLARQVYEDTGLDRLSLMHSGAASNIASAFSMNPWVRRVISVRKLPGGQVDVRLAYRQPAAMVYVDCENGWYAVDREGVLLPHEDFSPAEIEDFIHVTLPSFCPKGSQLYPGDSLGDHRVDAAARLAEFLSPVAEKAGIRMVATKSDIRESQPALEILTGTRDDRASFYRGKPTALKVFFWGSPPGDELPGEATAAMKLQSLLRGVPAGADLRMAGLARDRSARSVR